MSDIEEFEEWYLKHDVLDRDLSKVCHVTGGEYVYFYTATVLLFEQFLEIKRLKTLIAK